MSASDKKVCHLTSVHPRNDTRIFTKECKSLSLLYDVSLIVADGKGYEIKDNIKIYDIGKPVGRFSRMIKTPKLILKQALKIDADIYHFHDPELIPIGMKLKKTGKKVIYDVHEDVPRQLLTKYYLKGWLKIIISKIVELYENRSSKKVDFIITATPYIRERFLSMKENTIDINNYPLPEEFKNNGLWENKKNEICYIGWISEPRGIKELIKCLEFIQHENIMLNLCGNFETSVLEKEIKRLNGWKKVIYHGLVDRKSAMEILRKSKIGIVTLQPTKNYLDSLPVKMFEYMSAGLPVVCSDFKLWKQIVEGNSCGICVNPLHPEEIAKAIDYLLSNDDIAQNMGNSGRRAIENKYNWKTEENKLFNIYSQL